MKAQKIKKLNGFVGTAYLFKMSPPLEGYEHVVISSAVVPFTGPETYIFPCDDDGKIISWGELEGSQRGTLDYSVVLADLGYEEVLNDKEEY